ncbi:hypothetical protein J762_4354, partial [Acinetobacter baumannii 24845_9]
MLVHIYRKSLINKGLTAMNHTLFARSYSGYRLALMTQL